MRVALVFLIITSLNLIGCNLQNIQSDRPSPDLSDVTQLEQEANKAYRNEDWATAEKAYQRLTIQIPGDIEPWFRLGNVYARTNQLDAAVVTYREALTRDPENSKIWHNLGVIQLKQAANTFLEMQQYTEENDPLGVRARFAVNSIANLINTNFQPENEH